MPKVSFALALPVGTESMSEIIDIQVNNIQNRSLAIERLNKELPSGIRVHFIEEISIRNPSPQVKESYFNIKIDGFFNKEDLDKFLRSKTCLVIKQHRRGDRIVDIRSQVKGINLLSKDEVELVLRHGKGPEMKPAEIIKEVFALSNSQIEGMRILKTKCILT